MEYTFSCNGTCSKRVSFEIDQEGLLHNVRFQGGCNGNTQGISALVEGMKACEAMGRMKGIKCGNKATSCPDQLSHALSEALNS